MTDAPDVGATATAPAPPVTTTAAAAPPATPPPSTTRTVTIAAPSPPAEPRRHRAVVRHWRVAEEELDVARQRTVLAALSRTMYADEPTPAAGSRMLSHIRAKMHGYRHQDVSKHRFCPTVFIELKELVAMLHASGLRCFYCSRDVLILYKTVREAEQWTMDRIDNSVGHNRGNAVISCLGCNLSRRRIEHRAFEFAKQMRIIKVPAPAEEAEEAAAVAAAVAAAPTATATAIP